MRGIDISEDMLQLAETLLANAHDANQSDNLEDDVPLQDSVKFQQYLPLHSKVCPFTSSTFFILFD